MTFFTNNYLKLKLNGVYIVKTKFQNTFLVDVIRVLN